MKHGKGAGAVSAASVGEEAVRMREHRENVVALDSSISACIALAYFAVSLGNFEGCTRISSSPAYSVWEVVRLCGAHVFAAAVCLLMVFVEFRLPFVVYYFRALTDYLIVRLFVAVFLLFVTFYEKHLPYWSLSVVSGSFLAVFLFAQLAARVVFFRTYRDVMKLRHQRRPGILAEFELIATDETAHASYGSITQPDDEERKSGAKHNRKASSKKDPTLLGSIAAFQTTTDTPDWMMDPDDSKFSGAQRHNLFDDDPTAARDSSVNIKKPQMEDEHVPQWAQQPDEEYS